MGPRTAPCAQPDLPLTVAGLASRGDGVHRHGCPSGAIPSRIPILLAIAAIALMGTSRTAHMGEALPGDVLYGVFWDPERTQSSLVLSVLYRHQRTMGNP